MFIEQQTGNKIRQRFRRNEMNKLLKDCHAGLEQALEVFKVQAVFSFASLSRVEQTPLDQHWCYNLQ
jgi:hypothetical protein